MRFFHHRLLPLMLACGLLTLTGCVGFSSTVNLQKVAQQAGLKNITTGDGTFEQYQATGHVTSRDIGIAVGIPFVLKAQEIFPWRSNEELLFDVATEARAGGADALINTMPAREWYLGFPFFFVGLYVDTASGTGIRAK